jgi:hypothetical protein
MGEVVGADHESCGIDKGGCVNVKDGEGVDSELIVTYPIWRGRCRGEMPLRHAR